jgi:hypothetical protein
MIVHEIADNKYTEELDLRNEDEKRFRKQGA